jgi:hypothetical protein
MKDVRREFNDENDRPLASVSFRSTSAFKRSHIHSRKLLSNDRGWWY